MEYIHLNFLRKNKEDSEFSKYLYYNKRENSFLSIFTKNCPPADAVQTDASDVRRLINRQGPALSALAKAVSHAENGPAICKKPPLVKISRDGFLYSGQRAQYWGRFKKDNFGRR